LVRVKYEEAKETNLMNNALAGIYAAALTPIKSDYTPDLEVIPELLSFLARRGCHGALLLGTTGEGPSFSMNQRKAIWNAAREVRQEHSHFRLLAGTGTSSLEESIALTKIAFDLELDGVVVLPPYYFRNVSTTGLFAWFSELMNKAVPDGGKLFGYHFPKTTGVGLPHDLLLRMRDTYPYQFVGIKDSSGDLEHAKETLNKMGKDFLLFVGHDQLLQPALDLGASGSITALANICSPDLRAVWDAQVWGGANLPAMHRLAKTRQLLENFSPFPPALKVLMSGLFDFPNWPVCPPLTPLPDELTDKIVQDFRKVLGI
jgi:4-hydroxy-tetrahydrodipicolinate synthase